MFPDKGIPRYGRRICSYFHAIFVGLYILYVPDVFGLPKPDARTPPSEEHKNTPG